MAGQRNKKASAGDEKRVKTLPGLSMPPDAPPQKLETVGRYILGEHVGAGGMGSVRLARRTGSHADEWSLAIKMVHPHLARDPEYAERFRDEARLAMRVNHPYVCRVFEYGESDEGIPYIVMERLTGQPLSRVLEALKKDPIDPNDILEHCAFAARMLTWLSEALHVVHEMRDDRGQPMNIVHRDISPQNIFVLDDGSVRLLDFGIAQGKHRLAMTRTGNLRGKAPYMAPEYLLSEHFDRRIDVWSLGVVFWELLTLKTLYGGKPELQTLQMIVSQPAATPSSVCEGIPAALDLIVMRALARDPAARFQTAQALGRALDQWLEASSEPVSTRDVSTCLRKLFPPAVPHIPLVGNETGEMVVGTAEIIGHVARPSFAATKAYPEDWGPPRTRAGIGLAPALELGGAPRRDDRADMMLPDAGALGSGPKITILGDETDRDVPSAPKPKVADTLTSAVDTAADSVSTGSTRIKSKDNTTMMSVLPKAGDRKKLVAAARKSVWAGRIARVEKVFAGRAVRWSAALVVLIGAYTAGDRVGTHQVSEWLSGAPRAASPAGTAQEKPVLDGTPPTEPWPAGSARVAPATLQVPPAPPANSEPSGDEPAKTARASDPKGPDVASEARPEPKASEPRALDAKAAEARAAQPKPAAPKPPAKPPERAPERRVTAAAPPATRPRSPEALKLPPPVDAAPTGDVVVTCAAGPATVWKGATLLGNTPLRTRLPEGVHQLTVKTTEGGREFTVMANVTAGRIALVSAGR